MCVCKGENLSLGRRPEERGLRVTGSCELPGWELNSDSPEEQQVILSTDLFCDLLFYCIFPKDRVLLCRPGWLGTLSM